MASDDPIGIFDSGVGGLSVLRAVRRELPAEALLYVADSANAPYSDRSPELIERRSLAIAAFLIGSGAKAVVVACNTATGIAIETLRARYSIPIIGIEPAVKPAVAATRSGIIAVLATEHTLNSAKFQQLVAEHAATVNVVTQECVGLVEQVENGDLASAASRALVERCVQPMLDRGADTIVLGCTHYPFVREIVQSIAGPGVQVLDPAIAVARQLRRRLESTELLAARDGRGDARFFTSGDPERVAAVISRLLGRPASVTRLPERAEARDG